MNRLLLIASLSLNIINCKAQEFKEQTIDSEVTSVQPMTGIVLWTDNGQANTDAISLEYSYMSYADIVTAKSTYDWTVVDNLLDAVASRNHQTLLRFRFAYPGRTTTVPQYIKDLADYNETEGLSEGNNTYFPDWTNEELKRFTLEFYEKYAERYDNDPRLGFVQTGFGLWAEYHIYDGPFELGVTFPSKAFQTTFFNHLDNLFTNTYWSVSVDAAGSKYSPLEAEPELKDINFGVFDDSFMHSTHSTENLPNWVFMNSERYKVAPAGGEFSYFSDYDQRNVLVEDIGAYNEPYEIAAQKFHISYMIGNDQLKFHSISRVKEASMNSGYKFKVASFKTKTDSSIVEVINLGVAPLYIDAYITVNGVRSVESLKLLGTDEIKTFHISGGADGATLAIESDQILDTQTIEFFGTENDYERYKKPDIEEPVLSIENKSELFQVFPTISHNNIINIKYSEQKQFALKLYDMSGKLVLKEKYKTDTSINTSNYSNGLYTLILRDESHNVYKQKVIFQ